MKKKIIIAALTTALLFSGPVYASETRQNDALVRAWLSMTEEQRLDAGIEYKCAITGYTVEEFELLSRCVEAESNRQFTEEGYRCRLFVALTIINRVNSSSFPDTITGVISQCGQFSVYSSGAIYQVERTDFSDMAIIEARQMIADGAAPNVLYFNCVGYNYPGYCVPYDCIGGNYFMTVEEV